MRRMGHKKTPSHVAGHQRCALCHPDLKNGKKRERRNAKKQAGVMAREAGR